MMGERKWSAAGASLPPGALVADRYEVQGTLGDGGFGRLYQVVARNGERLAIRLTVVKQPRAVDALKGTIALHEQLAIPSLCRLRDCGEHAAQVWYAMDYLDGESLDHSVYRSGPLPAPEAARVICDAAEALGAIHDAGYVHQDVKQGNLFRVNGAVKLLEFGVVAALAADGGVPAAKLSTPSTRAPGQIGGLSTDPRMDVFALGAVLYYLLVGRRAFPEGRQFLDIAERLGVPPPPVDHVPARLRPIVERALAMRPDDRYQTARELASELAKVRAVA